MNRVIRLVLLVALWPAVAHAQARFPARSAGELQSALVRPAVAAAVAHVDADAGAAGLYLWMTDGPLTPIAALRGRTNENGYLLASVGAAGMTDGPLTPIASLRGRTDENGYLRVALGNGTVIPAPVGTLCTAPGYTFTGDLNSGLGWLAADSVALCVGGATIANAVASGLAVTGNIAASNAIQAGSGSVLGWSGRARFISSTDGLIVATNQAQSSLTGLQLGCTGVGCPMLKPSGTDVQFRTANDASYTAVDAGSYKLQGVGLTFPTVCSNTSASTAITTTSAETAFDLNCSIAAGTLVAGSTIIVDARGIYSGNNTDTLVFKLKACTVAGCATGTAVTLATTTAVTLGAVSNQYWDLNSQVIAFTVGASGTLEAQTKGIVASAANTVTTMTAPSTATHTVDTTVIEYLTLTAKFSTNSASDSITLRNFQVVVR